MIYYKPIELAFAPFLAFACCAMSDEEYLRLGMDKDPLILSEVVVKQYEQFQAGVCLYKITNGTYTLRPESEFTPFVRAEEEAAVARSIEALKKNLAETDWMVIKCVETGVSFAQLYPEAATQRAGFRNEINQLEEQINDFYES